MNRILFAATLVASSLILGCDDVKPAAPTNTTTVSSAGTASPTASNVSVGAAAPLLATNVTGKAPVFVLGWSEYPSSSVFGVAHERGLIDGKEGQQGTIEKKWNVDIVLKQVEYDTLITLYGSNQADAVCIVAFDTLPLSLSRPAVNFIPVSTSKGGDAVVVTNNVADLNALKGKPTYGLEKTVSQYLFERVLTKKGLNPADFPFKNMDPATAAQAVQTNQNGIDSIVVWNPFVLQTLRTRQGTKVLFDSSDIKDEIVDVVVAGKDSLAKPGGEDFASAVVDTFYTISDQLKDAKVGDEVTVQLGAKFSNLGLADMKTVLTQTVFYGRDEAIALYSNPAFRRDSVESSAEFLLKHGGLDKKPTIGYNDDNTQVNFTTKYLERVKARK